jgi:trigger factor
MNKKLIKIIIVLIIISLMTCIALYFQSSKIIYTAKYYGLEYDYSTPEVTEEEIDNKINLIVEGYTKLVTIKNRDIIIKGDVVNINYTTFINNIQCDSITELDILIGSGGFNPDIENYLIGKYVGDTIEYISQKNFTYNITINSIKYFDIPELNQQFFEEYFNCQTQEEFREIIKENIFNSKEVEIENDIEKYLFDNIINKSVFIVKDKDIEKYYEEVLDNYNHLANIYGVDIEIYIAKYLNIDMEVFVKLCYDKSIYNLKRELLIQFIWKKEKFIISNDDLIKYGFDNYSSLTNDEINYIVKDKVEKYLINLIINS